MVHMSIIEARLSQLGIRVTRWFRAEVRELQHILMENENIIAVACGRYFGGFAMLVATDQRLLLIDKKTLFMTVEDIRYDMISEIDFSTRLMDSTVTIFTVNKQHRFTSMKNKVQLRRLINYVQQRVMELRHYGQNQEPIEQLAPRHRLPSIHMPHMPQIPYHLPSPIKKASNLPQIVGAAALRGPSLNSNPYARGSLVTKSQWSTTAPQTE